jgi:hypothetical protein
MWPHPCMIWLGERCSLDAQPSRLWASYFYFYFCFFIAVYSFCMCSNCLPSIHNMSCWKKLRWEWLVPVWLQLNIWDNAYLNMENCVLHMMCYAHVLILVLSSCSILGGKYIAEILECMWRQYCTVCAYLNRSKYLWYVEFLDSRRAIKLYSGYSDTSIRLRY